jgi:hypothetical protein
MRVYTCIFMYAHIYIYISYIMLYDIWYISWPILDTLYIIVYLFEPKIEVLQDMFQPPIKTDTDLRWVEYTHLRVSILQMSGLYLVVPTLNFLNST